jgi:hypothetical protein
MEQEPVQYAKQFKERHPKLFEKLSDSPSAWTVMEDLTLQNALTDRMVDQFTFVLQECAWSGGDEDLPRIGATASAEKKMAYGLVMEEATGNLRDKTLARLGLNYIDPGTLNDPETGVLVEMAERIDPGILEGTDSAS